MVAAARCFEGRRARGWLGTGRRERWVVVSPRSSFLRWVNAAFSPERFAVSLWARPQAVGFPRHEVLRRVGRRFAFRQRRLIAYFSVLNLSLILKSVYPLRSSDQRAGRGGCMKESVCLHPE